MNRMLACFHVGAVLCASLLVAGCGKQTQEQPEVQTRPKRSLTVCSFGGSFQESQRKAFFAPFEAATGIKVEEANYDGDLAKLKAMVLSGKVTWDVVDVELATMLLGARDNLYEPIDYSVVDPNQLMPQAKRPYGVATDFYATGIGFREDSASGSAGAPISWREFWDIGRFPGSRSLRKDPYTTLEFALLADGVDPAKLYPLDLDRAFGSLDKIKGSIKVWWTTGQQPVQLLANKEVAYTSIWSGRIWNARHTDKLPVAFCWNGGLLEPEWWVVPRGSKNKDIAYKFIDFASRPKPQADMARAFGVGPTNPKAIELLDKELAAEMPTALNNLAKEVFVNGEWWAENRSKVMDRWNKWLLE